MTEAIREDTYASEDTHLNRKTGFIVICYVVVIILLSLLFTWAKYVQDISGETLIPEAKGFMASIYLGDESVEVFSTTLEGLLPGSSSENDGQMIEFVISNSDETGTVISEIPIEYKISVYTTGNIPMDLNLVSIDEDGTEITYEGQRVAWVSENLGDGYKYDFYITSDAGDLEAEFALDGIELNEQQFELHYSWSSQDGYVSENMQKEIELLEIRAVVTSGNEYE